jgi:7,8-dihydroneopterin aldolase/epimerase/oxygenase
MNTIQVHGIRSYAYHGCLKEETKIGGNYIIDIDINYNFKQSAVNDDLKETVDYVEIKEIVLSEMKVPSKLIETVAYRIIQSIYKKHPSIDKCKVVLKKINPPIDGDIDYVSVIVEE